MNFLELARSRRSIRSFKSDDVPEELLIQLIEAAQAAPSGGNCQPWHFYIIKNRAVIQRIRDEACKQAFITTAPVLILVCADIARSEERYAERGRELYCLQDTAAAIENLLLCAASLGLGTCWCGAFDENRVTGILDLPGKMRPVAIIPVGYSQKEGAKTGRRPIEEITTFI